ncbi:uncharacterized protein LOC136084334 [Hydra vulgaris]|uniref:Uncharacterized protein LOC136084334 n=1 Tax=Hydra vulgaris TaxID=6087 RepID=A0ABM4CFH0_HYDVU
MKKPRRKKRMTEKHLKPVLSVGQSGDNHSESGNSGLFTPVVHTESSQNEVQHQQITQCVDFQSETNAMPKNMPGLPFDIISPLSKTFGHTTSEKLLLKILARQEEIIETQKLHSAMLYNIQQQINVTHGIMEEQIELNLPPKTTEDVAAIEEKLKDVDVKKNLVQVLVNNGGANLTDFVRRNMKHLFSPELARKYNLTGQKKKQPFQPLHLFQVMFCAAKKNYGTKENLSIKLLEEALSSWFSNARDRGKGGRKERVPVNAAEITL